ncbi:hypothetical protein PAEPH01_0267 [Pancytospora epiphaga]|nr:hypothetical protein PAEPH01_0267 [Pancytospora epiphaga]
MSSSSENHPNLIQDSELDFSDLLSPSCSKDSDDSISEIDSFLISSNSVKRRQLSVISSDTSVDFSSHSNLGLGEPVQFIENQGEQPNSVDFSSHSNLGLGEPVQFIENQREQPNDFYVNPETIKRHDSNEYPFMDPNINTDSVMLDGSAYSKSLISNRSFETEFLTGKNRRISVDKENLENKIKDEGSITDNSFIFIDKEQSESNIKDKESNSLSNKYNEDKQVVTGFVTGKNKKISIDKVNLSKIDGMFEEEEINHNTIVNNPFKTSKITESIISHFPEEDSKPVVVNLFTEWKMLEIFKVVSLYFKKEERMWIFYQFKWVWLYFYSNPLLVNPQNIEDSIIKEMKKRRDNESSVLRAIVEFDDIPCRHMVLGIIRLSEEFMEVYDGYYSVTARIDRITYNMLKGRSCDVGTKLHVFGAEVLLNKATSIFELTKEGLYIQYNGARIADDGISLGYSTSIAFCDMISWIRQDGGTVSGIVVSVKQVLESRYMITAAGYKNTVDDPEKEIEKVAIIAERAGKTLDDISLRVRRYVKMIVSDSSGECQLTWWNPLEVISVGDKYKFIYLKPISSFIGVHLSTTNKSYIEKIPS